MSALTEPTPLSSNCELEPPNWMSIHPNSPPTNSTPHLVVDGENWQKIANAPQHRAKIAEYRKNVPPELLQDLSEEMANARALIYFNFDTVVPEYVNWFLLNITCCYDATEDRFNRRFRTFDRDQRSPRYGKIERAGKIYIPNGAAPGPKPLPVAREVKMWAHLAYQDGLFDILLDLASADTGLGHGTKLGTVGSAIDAFEGIVKGQFRDWTPEQLRKIAKIRKYARPLRKVMKYLKYAGWASKGADILIGSRAVTGYLVMSFSEPFDTHYAWELDIILGGLSVFSDDAGEFSTAGDPYTIRTSVFDPTRQWHNNEVTMMMAFNSLALSVHRAFKRSPNASDYAARAFAGDRYVQPTPGPLDWTLNLRPLTSISGYGIYRNSPCFTARLENGRYRNFSEIMSPLSH